MLMIIAPKGLYVPVPSNLACPHLPPDFRQFLRTASAPVTLSQVPDGEKHFSMSRGITKNQHVLSYIEARNLWFFQKRRHFFEKKRQFYTKFVICGG